MGRHAVGAPGRPTRSRGYPARREAGYRFEREAWRGGLRHVAGVDEAGRGPLAGPVVAGAVILDPARPIRGLQDSKLLTPSQRAGLFPQILDFSLAVGIGSVDPATIDRINILEATRRAMLEAITNLAVAPDLVLIDAVRLVALPCAQKSVIKGDRRSASIAAASIVAKVTRDRLMIDYDREFPDYGFARHKGYATAAHQAALAQYGPCALHRRSFHGVSLQGELFPGS
ncbi:MAG: ribonuclease HII [Candidatus Rokubacteria bacterium]|nr:ribonuclease HII [Candidatus Rokubacteria bacterium]